MYTSHKLAVQLVERLAAGDFLITTVESCTGGALANAITDVPGSSDVFKDGFVTYSNEAKIALGVPEATLTNHSVYSLQTALAMAEAGAKQSAFTPHVAVGITGSLNRADPDNSRASVIGEVYIAVIQRGSPVYQHKLTVPAKLARSEAKHFVIDHVFGQLLKLI